MVILNLRDDCVARTATNFRRGMTDKRFLELEITAWLASPERKRQINGELYYDGKQAVLGRKRMALDDDGKLKELKHLDIPTSLTEFGVPKEDLEALVSSGMEVTRLLVNNMREVTPDDARKIYQEVL